TFWASASALWDFSVNLLRSIGVLFSRRATSSCGATRADCSFPQVRRSAAAAVFHDLGIHYVILLALRAGLAAIPCAGRRLLLRGGFVQRGRDGLPDFIEPGTGGFHRRGILKFDRLLGLGDGLLDFAAVGFRDLARVVAQHFL